MRLLSSIELVVLLLALACMLLQSSDAFLPLLLPSTTTTTRTRTGATTRHRPSPRHNGDTAHGSVHRLFGASSSSSSSTPANSIEANSTSVREMKERLRLWGIESDDCFDKESLLQRYQEAQQQQQKELESSTEEQDEEEGGNGGGGGDSFSSTASSSGTAETTVPDPSTAMPSTQSTASQSSTTGQTSSTTTEEMHPDGQDVLRELRGLRVKELRTELAARGERWAGLLEKEDLVRAVYRARMQAAAFSVTGLITPGEVATLTGEQIQQEASEANESVATPLLVDAYAVWCGPCQMMAPQLQAAAATLGDTVRVAKFDTDQYPDVASQYRVQGLPTLLLFRRGREVARIEGALMKDQLLQWVQQQLDKTGTEQ